MKEIHKRGELCQLLVSLGHARHGSLAECLLRLMDADHALFNGVHPEETDDAQLHGPARLGGRDRMLAFFKLRKE